MEHSCSPNNIAEKMIEYIDALCTNDNSWIRIDKNCKKEILDTIEAIKLLKTKGYFVSYDLDKLFEIVKKSPTPKDAINIIPKELNFHQTLYRNDFHAPEFDIPLRLKCCKEQIEAFESSEFIKKFFEEKLSY